MNTEQVRRGLRNVQTRAATIRDVVDQGEDAIEAVLPLLQDRNEGVRWSAIRVISEIGDARAVGPLIRLLEQSRNVLDTTDALHSITGQNLGESADAWRQWARQNPDARTGAGDELLSDDALLGRATEDLPVTLDGEGTQYTAQVALDDGRSQQVWIDFSRTDPGGRPIVQLSTPCGTADAKQYETALKLNMSIPYGAIALALMDDVLYFAMVDAYLRDTVHPEDIAESLMCLARHGDSVEQSLSSEDRF